MLKGVCLCDFIFILGIAVCRNKPTCLPAGLQGVQKNLWLVYTRGICVADAPGSFPSVSPHSSAVSPFPVSASGN